MPLNFLQNVPQQQGLQQYQPGNQIYTQFGVNQGDTRSLQAALIRRQYDDYLRNFGPIEEALSHLARPQDTTQSAMGLVGNAYDRREGILQRRFAGLGIDLTGEQQAYLDKQSALSENLDMVTAANMASRHDKERLLSLISGVNPPNVNDLIQGR